MKDDLNRLIIGISAILIVTVLLTYLILQNKKSNLNSVDNSSTITDITSTSNFTTIEVTSATSITEDTIDIINENTSIDTSATQTEFQEPITTEPTTIQTTTVTTQNIDTTPLTEETSIQTTLSNDNSYSSNFVEYYNQDFNYSILYPDNFYISSNDYGYCVMTNNYATIKVYGNSNDGQSVENLYNQEVSTISADISYELVKKNYYIVSWIENGNVLYRKTIVDDNRYVTLEFKYQVEYKYIYDTMIENMVSKLEFH